MAASVGDANDAVRDGANPPPERGGSLRLNGPERVAGPDAATKSPHRDDVCLSRESPLRPDAPAGPECSSGGWHRFDPARAARRQRRGPVVLPQPGSPRRSFCLATTKAMSRRAGWRCCYVQIHREPPIERLFPRGCRCGACRLTTLCCRSASRRQGCPWRRMPNSRPSSASSCSTAWRLFR